jgi:Secretion system C-terminal sorting domain
MFVISKLNLSPFFGFFIFSPKNATIMTKFLLLLFLTLSGSLVFCQQIERSLVGCAGQTHVSASGFQISYSIGEPVIVPSPSATFDVPTQPSIASIGFQQPYVANAGAILSTNNRISAYPSPTTGHVRLTIHGDNFQVNSVRIYNSFGSQVPIRPFTMVNGSIDLFLNDLPAGLYTIAVTDKIVGNTVATRIIKHNNR